jgi:hypothetical protein
MAAHIGLDLVWKRHPLKGRRSGVRIAVRTCDLLSVGRLLHAVHRQGVDRRRSELSCLV